MTDLTAHRSLTPAEIEMIAGALSPATQRAYRRHLDGFRRHLDGRAADDRSLAAWLRSLHDRGLAPATIGQAASAVGYAASLDGRQVVGPISRAALAWIRLHGAGRGRGQAAGVTWDDVDRAADAAAGDGLAGLRDAAILSVASWALLRVSEIAGLDAADIEAEAPLTVLVRRSKTDQLSVGQVLHLGSATQRCRSWMHAAAAHDGPLFRPVRAGRATDRRLSPEAVGEAIKRRLSAVGIVERVSGHSLRIGSAQSLLQEGATLPELMLAGRWKSDRMPAHYTRGLAASRGAMARLRT